MIDMQLQFPDKCVTYSTFMEDLSAMVAVKLVALQEHGENLSQNEAWRLFGKAKVKSWVKRNLIQPQRVGKQKLEFKYSELYILNHSKN